MKVITSTGLVPVKALKRFKHHPAGRVFGVEPHLVPAAVKSGDIELHPVPDGVETHDYDVHLESPKGAPEAPAGGPAESAGSDVEIPEDWNDLHWMKKVKLAKDIAPDFEPGDAKWNEKIAHEVIEAELQRRAAADKSQET